MAGHLAVVLLFAGAFAGCGDDEPPAGSGATSQSSQSSQSSSSGQPPPPGESALCATKTLTPWSRKTLGVGGAVSFNEIMYHPAGDPKLEWIELYNPMGIDIDMSGFRLSGAVSYSFPSGTFIHARDFIVVAADAALLAKSAGADVAIGSYTGDLPDNTGTIELWNNSDRLLDSISYNDIEPWPAIPDGSGASLAKITAGASSELAESWTASARVLGTPGAANFPEAAASSTAVKLVPPDAVWRYLDSGAAPAADWASPAFNDSAWSFGPATLYATNAPALPVATTATLTADNFFALYKGKADGTGLTYIGRDAVGDWTSPETFQFQADPDDYVYIAAWEAPGNDGGPQSLIGQFALANGPVVSTSASGFEWVLGTTGDSPGGALGDPPPLVSLIATDIMTANSKPAWAAPQASMDKSGAPWGPALSNVFADGTQFIWADTFDSLSISNLNNSYVLFRSKSPLVPQKGATEINLGPVTSYFRTTFQAPADVTLLNPWLDALIDDGAIFYLNGKEILRLRMPAGAVTPSTLASQTVVDATLSAGNLFDASLLVPGKNVLAVEVHQAAANDSDITLGASLGASVAAKTPGSPPPGLALNEVAGATTKEFWIELANLGSTPVDMDGYVLASSSGGEHVLEPRTLAPGDIIQLTEADLGFKAALSDKIFLYSPDREAVVDGIGVASAPRGRSTKELRSWLYPDMTTPGEPNVFIEHDGIVINEIMYHPPPEAAPDGSIVKSSLEWIELYNRGATPEDLSGFQLADAITYEIPPGTVLPPGGYLVVASDTAAMKALYPNLSAAGSAALVGDFKGSLADSGENLILRDACGNPVDVVRYADGGRWPFFADGGGSSLELRDPRSDNAAPEAWAASDEASASAWQTITYEAVAEPSSVGPDGLYHELVIGLLDKGEVLLDDISVIEDPAGAAKEMIADGKFESGSAPTWRLLGNHRHSEVIADPTSPANHVLRVVATGPTEHMHNHLETTLAGGQTIKNGVNYRISLRAKWVGGSNQLNTRLYFDRLAKTTLLTVPAAHGTPGAVNSKAEKNAGPTYNDLRHEPVVPQPSEPVRVSVAAADPDGIANLKLFYSVDSGPFASVPMSDQGGGRFSGMIPGASASSVVQFYVIGEDSAGISSAFPAAGPASRALFKVDDGLGQPQALHTVRIVTTPADTQWLFDPKNLMSNDYLGATVIDDEREPFYDVGLRLKGSERGRPETVRVGFGVRFPPDHLFRGMHDDMLVDRSEGVGFGQRELLFNQAMNHAGSVTSQYDDLVKVLTPRPELVGPAHLQLARTGDLLLDFQFDNGGDGMLFEYELIYYPTTTDTGTPTGNKLPQPDSVVGTGIQDLGDDKEAYRLPFIIKNNRWRDDYRGFIAFAKVFGLSGPAFDAQVGDVIDVDEWLRAFAFATLSGAVDNYAAGAQHNGFFYLRPSDGRALYFPHDLDYYGGSPQSPLVSSPDLAKLVASPPRRRAYYGHLYDIIVTSYNGQYMAHWCDHLGQLLPGQNFPGYCQFITARADWVLNSAPDAITKSIPKVAFQINTNGGAPLSVMTASVTLDGTGWIDVDEVRGGQPAALIPLTWLTQTGWQATVPLQCGANTIDLFAMNRHGIPVGNDSITVTRTGNGCP